MTRRPNILWYCTDQQRYDTIACLGNEHIQTPNLDRFCAEGTAFTHAHCQSPICTPSRSSFMTGLYPSSFAGGRNGNGHFPNNERVQLISKRLADAGYDCGLIGKLHIASAWNGEEERTEDGYRYWQYSHAPGQEHPERNAYQNHLRAQGIDLDKVFKRSPKGHHASYQPDIPDAWHQTTWCSDRAIEFINEQRDQAWMLSINAFDPHPPFDAPDAWANRYDPDSLPAPIHHPGDADNQDKLKGHYFQQYSGAPGPRQQTNKANYYGMVSLIDAQFGRLLQALEDSGQADNTIVIFTSDHGEMLGDHGLSAKGCRFYEGLVRVPLIIRWPGQYQAGQRSDALVELTDLAPTLAEAAGIDAGWHHGRSLVPLLTGQKTDAEHRDYVRCEFYDTLQMTLPERPEDHRPSWATMHRTHRHKICIYHGSNHGELYDMQEDPTEGNNLWNDPAHAELKQALLMESYDLTVCSMDQGPAIIGRY